MSKPSERIKEIQKEIHKCDGIIGACNLCVDDTRIKMFAIIQYLDEQYEQQKPNEDKTKLLGYANRAIRTSDAVYNTDLRENL